jgi:hypothetical protein
MRHLPSRAAAPGGRCSPARPAPAPEPGLGAGPDSAGLVPQREFLVDEQHQPDAREHWDT